MNKLIRIVIFAKAPLPGLAKTRLIPALGEEATALLAKRMLLHTVHQALAADIGSVELCVTPDADDPVWRLLNLPDSVTLSLQGDGELGQRMSNVAQRVINDGASVILIGTDSPALNASRLKQLAARLQDTKAVMLPTEDGGYVALGLSCFDNRVFDDIAWSTSKVAIQTIERLLELGLSFHIGQKIHDIDEPGDLQWLPDSWKSELDPEMDFHSVMESTRANIEAYSTLICPLCGHRSKDLMPVDACQFFYDCKGCGEVLRPNPGDCCVYCSFGDVACPPVQAGKCCRS